MALEARAMSETSGKSTLSSTLGGGPCGLGDPDDKTLRKVEIEILVPKKMRDRARDEKCVEEVKDFTNCCKDSSISMIYKCRKENAALKSCLEKWYKDETFKEECKQEYLEERSEYRRTGISQKARKAARLQSM